MSMREYAKSKLRRRPTKAALQVVAQGGVFAKRGLPRRVADVIQGATEKSHASRVCQCACTGCPARQSPADGTSCGPSVSTFAPSRGRDRPPHPPRPAAESVDPDLEVAERRGQGRVDEDVRQPQRRDRDRQLLDRVRSQWASRASSDGNRSSGARRNSSPLARVRFCLDIEHSSIQNGEMGIEKPSSGCTTGLSVSPPGGRVTARPRNSLPQTGGEKDRKGRPGITTGFIRNQNGGGRVSRTRALFG